MDGSASARSDAFLAPLFVGRQRERSRLQAMLAEVNTVLVYGPGGVGKSTLALAVAARWPGPVVHHHATRDEPLSSLLDDARRQLSAGSVPEATDDEQRLRDLAARLEESRALWLIDDLHHLRPDLAAAMIAQVGQLLRRGRLLATARELIARGPQAPERAELRLGGLEQDDARQLWASLDHLYGTAHGFEAAWARSRGSPFVLRRAHAGELDDADPIAASVAALDADEQAIAGLLALTEVKHLADAVATLLPAPGGRTALRRLAAKLIISVDGAGRCTVHDLFRDPVRAILSPAEERSLRDFLVRLHETSPEDPVVRVRERCRHLHALDRLEEAGAMLLAHAGQLVRSGAAGELLRALDAIPPARRSVEVRLARARTLAHLLELFHALDELRELGRGGVPLSPETRAFQASIALHTLQLDEAERTLRSLLKPAGEPDSPPLSRDLIGWLHFTFAVVRTYQGDGEEARASLVQAEADAGDDAPYKAFLAFCRAYTLWIEERDDQLEEPLRRSLSLARGSPNFRAAVLAPAFCMAMLARLGHFDEAEQALQVAEEALSRRQDPRMRLDLRSVQASFLFERGETARALAAFQEVAEQAARGGYALGALWANCWAGRAQLLLGRRAAGLRALEDARRLAERAGARGILALIARALDVGARSETGAPEEALDAWVVDGRSHEVRMPDRVISLKTRPLLRRLLYRLAARPGEVVSKENLVRAVWSRDYNPAMHDNPLRVNVRYLRSLLSGTQLIIEFEEDGYRIAAPPGFCFIAADAPLA